MILVQCEGEEADPKADQPQFLLLTNSYLTVSTLLSKEVKSTSKYLGVLKAKLISLLFIKVVSYFPLKYLFQLILLSDSFSLETH